MIIEYNFEENYDMITWCNYGNKEHADILEEEMDVYLI